MENLFKERLKKLRIQNDISQKELAESLHLSKGVISSYESGKSLPNCQTLILIAHFFNVSIDYITGVTNVYSTFPIARPRRALFYFFHLCLRIKQTLRTVRRKNTTIIIRNF